MRLFLVMIACMNFVFTNLNTITLVVWLAFFCIVVTQTLRGALVKNISYGWLVMIAVSIHLLYGVVATLGQYVVWNRSEVTRVFLSSKLSPEVPFPSLLEWTRPLLGGAHGYFAFYSFQHFFLSIIVLFFVTGLFVLFFKIYSQYRHLNLKEGDIAIIALSFLIAGWPGVIILVPLGFIFAIFFAMFTLLKSTLNNRVDLPRVFLFVAGVAFIFGPSILNFFHRYSFLKF